MTDLSFLKALDQDAWSRIVARWLIEADLPSEDPPRGRRRAIIVSPNGNWTMPERRRYRGPRELHASKSWISIATAAAELITNHRLSMRLISSYETVYRDEETKKIESPVFEPMAMAAVAMPDCLDRTKLMALLEERIEEGALRLDAVPLHLQPRRLFTAAQMEHVEEFGEW